MHTIILQTCKIIGPGSSNATQIDFDSPHTKCRAIGLAAVLSIFFLLACSGHNQSQFGVDVGAGPCYSICLHIFSSPPAPPLMQVCYIKRLGCFSPQNCYLEILNFQNFQRNYLGIFIKKISIILIHVQ